MLTSGPPLVLLRGGGDLATGVAARLHRSGFDVVVTEIPAPKAVRRLVALAEAVYKGKTQVEDLQCQLVEEPAAVMKVLQEGQLPLLIDPEASSREILQPVALVDARMRKVPPEIGLDAAPWVIGLGPGFEAGVNCHAVIETMRGHHLGRVYWQGGAEPDTGVPEAVSGHDRDRVLRSPAEGVIKARKELGSIVKKGETIALVDQKALIAPFNGVLRGLVYDGLEVHQGEKVGDLDPRINFRYCFEISDKALAVGGGVLEALLSHHEIRSMLGH